MQLPDRWVENCATLLRAFNEKGVEYLLIGSMAKSHYRSQPHVTDMDLMINCTQETQIRVLSVLRENLNYLYRDDPEKLTKPCKRLLLFDGSVDVLTPPAQGFNFDTARSRSTEGMVYDIRVPIASMCDLEVLDSLGAGTRERY